jgi:hypothetical protein
MVVNYSCSRRKSILLVLLKTVKNSSHLLYYFLKDCEKGKKKLMIKKYWFQYVMRFCTAAPAIAAKRRLTGTRLWIEMQRWHASHKEVEDKLSNHVRQSQ